jgi:hypothetical protein
MPSLNSPPCPRAESGAIDAIRTASSASARRTWLLGYFLQTQDQLDVLNRDFVDAYSDATQAKVAVMMFGANKCPQLGQDLASLYREGLLNRQPAGLTGMAGMGFPRWVYSYSLTEAGRTQAQVESSQGGA